MDSPSVLLDKITRFIEQQQELYGDFAVNSSKQSVLEEPLAESNEDSSVESGQNDQNGTEEANQVQESPVPDNNEEPVTKAETQPSLQEQIKACTTLDELRSLCAAAEELKTDLEDTNLVFGVGNPSADLMIVGEAPGVNEDQQGEPFVGQAGQLLDKIMAAVQFSREDIYIANILKHRPPNNRDPKPEERQRSLPFLLRQIEIVDPKLILCVGRIAATTLLNEDATLKSMRQQFHAFHGRELMVTYHPAALLRNQQWKRPTWEDVQLLRKRYDELTGNQ